MDTIRTRNTDQLDTATEWGNLVADLYVRHFEELCRTTQRLLDSRHAAEEAVQDAFVRLATLRHRPAPGCELSYVRSIAMNQARSALRHRGVVRRTNHRMVSEPDRDLVTEAVLAGEAVRLVRAHVRTLPMRQRQVVSLRHLAGLSESETAALLSISAGSVKTHASRALSAMRAKIGDVA